MGAIRGSDPYLTSDDAEFVPREGQVCGGTVEQ